MATFLINTAGVFQEGTPQDDFFIVEGSAFEATLYGNDGNDEFDMTDLAQSGIYGNFIVGGNPGDDTLDVVVNTGASVFDSYFGGGQGDDLLNISADTDGRLIGNTIQGGIGDDDLDLELSASAIRSITVNGNAGDDTVNVSAAVSAAGASFFIAGGADSDIVSFTFSSDQSSVVDSIIINGGLGTDLISFEAGADVSGIAGVNINGGSFGTIVSEDLADNIFVSANDLTDSTIAGNNGDDVVAVNLDSAGTTDGLLVAGNVGNDTLSLSGGEFNNTTIGGGAGDDLIEIESAGSFSAGSSVIGGEGDDVILADDGEDFSGTTDGVTFQGGLGADLFTTTAADGQVTAGAGFYGGKFNYETLADSTLAATDTIVMGSADTATETFGSFLLEMPSSVDVFNGQVGATNLFFTGGVLEFSGTVSANNLNLGQVVGLLDANLSEGDAVAFRLSTANSTGTEDQGYVFVKGASDDLLVEFAFSQDTADGAAFQAGVTTLTNDGSDALILEF